jgi:membrane protease YdiL (CAAX protease family)
MNSSTSTSKSPLIFFLLVFALCIPIWLVGAVTRLQLLPGLPVSSLVVVSPVIAALILVYRENGIAGMTKLLKRSFDCKRIRAKVWYAPIILFWPGVMVLEYGLMHMMGSPVPAPQFPVLAPLIMFLTFFIAALGEELGWSGYIMDTMQSRWNALQTGVLLGSVWAAWHIVLLVQAQQSPEYIAWQCLVYVPERVLFVWLYNNTGKSVFAAAVFHAMLNVSWRLFPINGSYYDPRITGLIVAVAAVIVTVMWGPQTLARYGYARSSGCMSKSKSG